MSHHFPVIHRPTLRLRLVRLPSKLRPLHETTFPVRPRGEVVSAPLLRGTRGRKTGITSV
ncbi:MAG: hypothetical protein NTV51_06185 [Verrucomicrobia bacterium]|nr:hypothetical protein [Verrucomicrobiota bacterium]